MKKIVALIAIACAAGMHITSVQAQNFPTKPIRIVVPYAAGGGADIVARLLAAKLQDKWGKGAFVENRTGAGGNIGAAAVASADPDGHTLLFTAQGPLAVNKALYAKLPYEPSTLTPISLVVVANSVLLAHPKVGARTLADLVRIANAKPGSLNYASQGVGTQAHLTAELFASVAKAKMTHVPYGGSGPALTDLVNGVVDIMFGELAPSGPYITSGALTPLAITGDKRATSLPEVPTVAETFPGFSVTSWWALVGPAGMERAVTDQISAAVSEAVKQPDVEGRLTAMGMIPTGSTSEELRAFQASETAKWTAVVREIGVKLN